MRIIAGAIIPLWQRLKSKDDAKLRVVRVSTVDGQRIVGVEIPRSQVGRVLRSLGLDSPTVDPRQLFTELMEGGETLDLVSDLKLKPSTLQGDRVIELVCHDPDRFEELRSLGLINEQISYKQRFFVPAGEAKGIPILTELLSRYPILSENSEESELSQHEGLVVEVPATEVVVVDLEQWVLPPKEAEPKVFVEKAPQPPREVVLELPQGVPLVTLLEQRANVQARTRRRTQLVAEDQGILFSLTE